MFILLLMCIECLYMHLIMYVNVYVCLPIDIYTRMCIYMHVCECVFFVLFLCLFILIISNVDERLVWYMICI